MSARSISVLDRAAHAVRIAHRVTIVVTLASASMVAGCGGDARTEREQVVAQDSARRAAIASTEASAAPPIALTHERDADLTGDRVPELLRVTARGTRPESLAVTLSVRDSSGATLYRESWMAGTWLARIDPDVLTPAIADSIVRRRIDDLLGDDAITRPAPPNATVVDARIVAMDVAERAWRTRNGVADSVALPVGSREAIAANALDTLRVRALVAELRRQPSLGWLQGDGRQAIAWSPTERRFVRVRRCC